MLNTTAVETRASASPCSRFVGSIVMGPFHRGEVEGRSSSSGNAGHHSSESPSTISRRSSGDESAVGQQQHADVSVSTRRCPLSFSSLDSSSLLPRLPPRHRQLVAVIPSRPARADCSRRGPLCALFKRRTSYFKMMLSDGIDMDLFMRPG